MKKFALCLLALALFASSCWAKEEEDEISGGTWKALCDKISDIQTAGSGGKLTIKGNYEAQPGDEPITISSDITLIGKDGATLDGGGVCRVIQINDLDVNGGAVKIQGLTIKNGNANMSTDDNHKGGGIHISSSNAAVTVENCVFDHNTASEGGGLCLDVESLPYTLETLKTVVTQCTFINNVAERTNGGMADGGGVFVPTPSNYNFTFTNCTFTGNSATGNGGGANLGTTGNNAPTVNYCTFVDNKLMGEGQGAEIFASDGVTVQNSIIHGSCAGDFTPDKTNLLLSSAPTPESADAQAPAGTRPVIHTVFRVKEAVGRGTSDGAPTRDQLGETRKAPHTLGAVAFTGDMTFTVKATKGLTPEKQAATKFTGYAGQEVTLSPDVTPVELASGAAWSIKESDTALPLGLTLDKATGVISGTSNAVITAAKDYTFTLKAENIDYTASKDLTVTIIPRTYTLSVTAPTFTQVNYGYTQPAAEAITIKSTGNSDATISKVELSGTNPAAFTLNKTDGATIAADTTDNETYTVRPNANLDVGSYAAIITVTYNNNATASADVSFSVQNTGTVAEPSFKPAASSYIGKQNVEISCTTPDAAIYYTINGDEPSTSSTHYTEAIPITETTTLKAIAVKKGMENSTIATANYTITAPTYTLSVTAPTFKEEDLGYVRPEAKAITITSTGNSDAMISKVALSGANPAAFTLNRTDGTTIKASTKNDTTYTVQPNTDLGVGTHTATITVTYNNNATASADVSFSVKDKDMVAKPTFMPAAGTYDEPLNVTLTCETEGATIYYTTDGTDPTATSKQYTEAIPVTKDATLKAIAVKEGMKNSSVAQAAYTISKTPAPTLTGITLTLDKASESLTVEAGGTAQSATFTVTKAMGTFSDGTNTTTQDLTSACTFSWTAQGLSWVTPTSGTSTSFTVTAKPGKDVTAGDGYTESITATPTYQGQPYKAATATLTVNVTKAEKPAPQPAPEPKPQPDPDPAPAKYDCALTVAPATLTVLLGASGTLDLSNCVKFEKVYSNGERQTVTPKLSFKVVKTPDKMRMDGWFTLNENGVATATKAPDLFSSSSYSGTVQYEVTAAADGNTATKTGTLKVAVEKKLEPVKITTTTLPQPEQNKSYSQQLKAQGEEPIKWEIAKGELPRGLKLDPNTGRIFGTPLRTRVADIKKILSDNAGSSSEFTVRARSTNPSYPSGSSESFHEKTFNFATAVADQKPSGWTQTYDDKINPSTLKWSITFKTKKGTNVTYTHDDPGSSLRSPYLVDVRTGSGNIRFTLAGMRNEYAKPRIYYHPHEYNFLVMGKNSAGTAYLNTTYKLEEIGGGIHQWGPALGTSTQGAIVSVSDGGTDSETGDAPSASVTYFTNGSAGTDENGETIISAVIGKPVGNVEEGKDYVYKDVPTMLNALKDSEDKIVSVEFREGTTVEGLDKLHNLSELAIDMCALTSLDLRGNTKLKKLSLFGCENLKTLNASGCSVLASLNVTECPALADVDLSGNVSLDVLDANDCWALKTLDLTGCAALTDVFLNSADITTLDLSACSGLKALSLEDASKLETLTLPAGASFDNFTLTGSRIASLTLKGTEELTSLDLSRNAEMTKLVLSGCSALSELDVSGCSELRSLDVSGCTELEKLTAHDCAKLYTMDLGDSNKLRELGVGGCTELRALDVSGKALGYLDLDGLTWLLDVNCSGQFIGNIDLSQPLNLKNYAGNNLGCVSDVQGYGADGAPVKTEFHEDTGDVTFASAPESVSYSYDTGLYDNVMDVTLSSAAGPDPDSPTSNKDSGGGCDAFFGGLLALAALIPTLTWKRK